MKSALSQLIWMLTSVMLVTCVAGCRNGKQDVTASANLKVLSVDVYDDKQVTNTEIKTDVDGLQIVAEELYDTQIAGREEGEIMCGTPPVTARYWLSIRVSKEGLLYDLMLFVNSDGSATPTQLSDRGETQFESWFSESGVGR